jgi:hypothetical protein
MSAAAMQLIFAERFKQMFTCTQKQWKEKLAELIPAADTVYDPEDASYQGQFNNLLDNFFTANRPARNRDELIKGNSFIENGRIIFRSEDLFNYLTIRHFKHTPHETWGWLKQMGATAKQLNIKGKAIRVWSLPEPEKHDNTPITLPTEVEQEEL